MGFDWEEILGDTDYEDAVDMAAEALEKMQEQDEEAEEADMEAADNEAEAESATEQLTNAEQKSANVCKSKPTANGGGFMDGCDDEPVFN